MSRALRFSALFAAAAAALPGFADPQIPTHTWVGTSSNSWSAGTWVIAPPPFGGSASTVPQFNNSSASSYTATNNLGPFTLNGLNFNASSSGTITVNNAMGSSLRFVPDGAASPAIHMLSSSAGAVLAPLRIASNLDVKGPGTGVLTINGLISGDGSLTIDRNNGTVLFSTMSAFAGGTNVNSGTVQFNSASALGKGTITIGGLESASTFRTLNSSFFETFNPIVTNQKLNVVMGGVSRWTMNGLISGSAGIRNAGVGTLVLRGNNTYGGSTLIEGSTAGTVSEIFFHSNANLGATSTPVVFRDATGGGAGSALTYEGIGSIDLIHPLQVDANSEARITPLYTNSTLLISGGISGQGDLRIGFYPQSGVVELRGANTYSGETWVTTGTLRFDSDARFGNSDFIILDGGCIMPTGNWSTNRSVTINSNTKTKNSAINTAGFTVDLASGLESTIAGLTDLMLFKSGAGSMRLGNIVGSGITVNAGDVTLYDAATVNFVGSAAGLSPIMLNRGGSLILDNSSTNPGNRLQDNGTISMNGGTLGMRGNLLLASSETTGTLALGTSSFNVIDLQPTLLGGLTLTPADVINAGGAGVLFRGADLGVSSKVIFSTPPTLVGAGGAVGTPQVSVLAGGFGDDSAAGSGSGFVTHGPNGVRLLIATEYDATIVSGAATNSNVSLNSVVAGINSPTTVNTLRLLNGSGVAGSSTLNVSSGGILVPAGANASIAVDTVNGSAIHLRNNGSLNLLSKVNAATLNLSGIGVTTASGILNVTGGISIHEGTLRSAADNLIPDSRIVTVNEQATWDLNGRTETIAGLTQQNIVTLGAGAYGTVNINGGTLTLSPATGTTAIYSGKLTGSGSIIKSGAGSIVFNGQDSNFSGQVTIQQGTLRLNSIATAVTAQTSSAESRRDADADSVLSCSTVQFDVNGASAAELKLSDKLIGFSRPITVNGNTTAAVRLTTRNATAISSDITLNRSLQIAAGGGTFSGTISGPGSIIVTHPDPADAQYQLAPSTSMTGTNSYAGSTSVAGGSLLFSANIPNGGVSEFGNSTAAITLGDTLAGVKGSEIGGITAGTSISRTIVSGTGTGSINLTGRTGTGGGVTFAGPITLNRNAFLFSGANPVNNTVGTVLFSGAIAGSGTITINGNDNFTLQPRQQSNVILASSLSTIAGMTLTTGSLGIGASSAGATGPLGSGVLTVGINASTTEVPTIYAINAAQSVHNNLTFNTHTIFAGVQPITFNGGVAIGSVERLLYVEGANITMNGVLSGAGALGKDGPGTLTLGATNNYSGPTSAYDGTLVLGASQTPSSLNIGSTATVVVAAGGNKILRTGSLNMVNGATLDLTDSDAILDYISASPLPAVRARIIEGFNAGDWNGTGIRSSTAAGSLNPKTGIGYAEASVVRSLAGGTFSGESVDGTTVLLRYTALGDADLNGAVDSIDFGYLSSGYGLTLAALWNDGDFNYDGKVNTLDFNELSGNFGAVVSGPSAASASPEPLLGATVPEPTTLGIFGLIAIGARRRLRNRSR